MSYMEESEPSMGNAMTWWPIDTDEANGKTSLECGRGTGLSRDDLGRVYCPTHRHLHDQ